MSNYLDEQIAEMRAALAELRARQIRYIEAPVTAVDPAASTFTVLIGGQVDDAGIPLEGISAPPQFLPQVGSPIRLNITGAQPVYEPSEIAENAVTFRELDGEVVQTVQEAHSRADQAIADAAAAQQKADTAAGTATTALNTANGKNKVIYSPNAASASTPGITVGDSWFRRNASGVVIGSWEWDGAVWQPRTYGDQVLGSLTAGKITTGTLAAGVDVTVGPTTGDHTKLVGGSGVIAYAADPVDGVPDEVARFGRNSGGRDSRGRATWNIDQSGSASFQSVSTIDDPRFMGRPLIGDLLENKPRGILHVSTDIPAPGAYEFEQGLYEMAFWAEPGRAYEIKTNNVNVARSVANGRYTLQLRMTTDGTRPNLSSPRYDFCSGIGSPFPQWPYEGNSVRINSIYSNNGTSRVFVQMLLTLIPWFEGTATLDKQAGFFLWVEDIGPSRGSVQGVGMVNNIRGTTGAPATSTNQEHTVEFLANWTRTWREDGGIQGDGYAEQGYYAGKGNTRSMIGFPDMTGVLAGAQIRRVEVYLKNSHWFNGSGGTAIIRTHGWGSVPPSYSQNQFPFGLDIPGWPRYQGWWFNAPADWAGPIQSGAVRGITLGPAPNNGAEFYGRFEGSGSAFDKPTIRVVYAK